MVDEPRQSVDRRRQIVQSPFFGLLHPLVRIVVAVKNDTLMLFDTAADQRVQCFIKRRRCLQLIGKTGEDLSDNRIENDVRSGNRQTRPRHPELEFVPGKRKR